MSAVLDLSIVIPLLNEDESLPELTDWIHRVVSQMDLSWELIFVDDGSTDNSWQVIESLSQKFTQVKGIRFQRNYGKSAALNTAFHVSQGKVVITMDADLQDSPDEIPELRRKILEDGYDLVSGWEQKRHDPISKTIPTKLFNWATRKMSGLELNDFNCGLKAYRHDVIKSIEVYGEMHRYIPVIAKWAGFRKIGEQIVQHRPRKYGHTKFGLERFINGMLDLVTIFFVSKFGKRPMHFFGSMGFLMFSIGFFIAIYLVGRKIYWTGIRHIEVRDVTSQPLFYIGLTLLIVGVQFFLAGFVGELVSRSAHDRNVYLIRQYANMEP